MIASIKAHGKANRLLATADSARDGKNWKDAVASYEEYLAISPRNQAIWIQLGNCAKEAKLFAKALAAYLEALEINPANADLNLQLGHLYKLMGRKREALAAYEKAFALDSGLHDAQAEIVALKNGSGGGQQFDLPLTSLDFFSEKSVAQLIARIDAGSQYPDPFEAYALMIDE